MDVDIGMGKSGRRAYGLDDIAIVPSRRTRDPEDIDVTWQLGPHRLELPFLASAMDGVVDPAMAVAVGKLGGLGVLNLEGVQVRYEDPAAVLDKIASLSKSEATRGIQEVYREPIRPELIKRRVTQIKEAGVVTAASLTPQRVEQYYQVALDAGLDVLVIQGTVISAEHLSESREPLDLYKFIAELPVPVVVGGCASYHTALHLMRTGAVGVLIGVGPGHACTTRGVLGIGVPQATALADAAAARSRLMEETGRYVNVIADGGIRTGGDIAKCVACGADAVMMGAPIARALEAPGRGFHWGMATFHPELPRGTRVEVGQAAGIEEIIKGPAHENDGTLNLFGALRMSMATCGYRTLKEFQRAEVMVAPSLQTEGKVMQRSQDVGMGK
ncbi:MAG: GuaB3 family IMP dehydrogenase-related protein [Actinobacteria bacterium]|nr:GuaB3 family IMP dehydrogenase-related protein [Actinomycetota bacterium]MBU1942723.1 GuaB3 family IMP dehydrogenase-related protein [Actinomycetota bacterium]MBU2686045.1 GuaB3 family IMP dehydrogenase-related protein [Actinomycetota bacterium]